MTTLGLTLFVLVALLGSVLASFLHLDVRANERALLVRVRWLGSRLSFRMPGKRLEFRLFSFRLVQKPLDRPEERRSKRAKPERDERKVSWGEGLERAKAAANAGRYVLRHVRLEHLEAEVTVATPDPALTGELFGYASSLQGVLRGLAPNVSLRVTPDFGAQTPRGQIDMSLYVRVVHPLIAAWRVGRRFFKKRA